MLRVLILALFLFCASLTHAGCIKFARKGLSVEFDAFHCVKDSLYGRNKFRWTFEDGSSAFSMEVAKTFTRYGFHKVVVQIITFRGVKRFAAEFMLWEPR